MCPTPDVPALPTVSNGEQAPENFVPIDSQGLSAPEARKAHPTPAAAGQGAGNPYAPRAADFLSNVSLQRVEEDENDLIVKILISGSR